MDDGWIVHVKEQHSLGNLFSNINSTCPGKNSFALVKQMKQCSPVAVFTDYIETPLIFCNAYQGNKIRMRPHFETGHDLPFKLMIVPFIEYLLDGDLLPPPPAQIHLRRVPVSDNLGELQLIEVYDVLVCILGDLSHNKELQVQLHVAVGFGGRLLRLGRFRWLGVLWWGVLEGREVERLHSLD